MKKKLKKIVKKYSKQTVKVTIRIDKPKETHSQTWDSAEITCYVCRVFQLGKDDLNRHTIWALSQFPPNNGISFLNYTMGGTRFENMGQRDRGFNHENAPYIQFPVALLGDAKLTKCETPLINN